MPQRQGGAGPAQGDSEVPQSSGNERGSSQSPRPSEKAHEPLQYLASAYSKPQQRALLDLGRVVAVALSLHMRALKAKSPVIRAGTCLMA